MNRDEVLNVLRAHKPILSQRFGVRELALFGSFARDQATDTSDVDILVRFDTPLNWQRYFGAQGYAGRPAWSASGLSNRPGSACRDTTLRRTGGD